MYLEAILDPCQASDRWKLESPQLDVDIGKRSVETVLFLVRESLEICDGNFLALDVFEDEEQRQRVGPVS